MNPQNRIGKVFDIRRFSTHDGAGIRTTVFLKGCPLHCAWCQNPEGISLKKHLMYFESKCIGCGTCHRLAPEQVNWEKNRPSFHYGDTDKEWDLLIKACPGAALSMDCVDMTIDEVMNRICSDRVFYVHGGGVTLSGGEPLLQSKFALSLLQCCRNEGIHTAIETSAYVPSEVWQNMIPWVDTVFVDCKLIDNELHKKYTRVGNQRILENINWLLTSKFRAKATVRTPMIPGITATEENIKGISHFVVSLYKDVKYELLNYNPLAEAKYKLVDFPYCFTTSYQAYSRSEMRRFNEIARKEGVIHLVENDY